MVVGYTLRKKIAVNLLITVEVKLPMNVFREVKIVQILRLKKEQPLLRTQEAGNIS
jgi:hypothetical protein